MDIREGDILVVGDKEYPIRSCAEWSWGSTFTLWRTLPDTVMTKRSPAISEGKRGNPVRRLTGIQCSPLDPVDPELRQRLALNTPHELLQAFVSGEETIYHLILEDLKRSTTHD